MRKVKLLPSWLRTVFIILLVLGVLLRFVNLDSKIYWGDESATSLRLAGYKLKESIIIQNQAKTEIGNRLVLAQDLQKYQFPRLKPDLKKQIIQSAVDEPQLPPLYFMLARWGSQWFGHSVTVTRGIATLSSLIMLIGLYWLSMELFSSQVFGWMTVLLVALSPFHLLYAQEARPYSLWAASILLSSASLLRALRLQTIKSWGLYTLTLIISLYSFLFTFFVILAHSIYILIIEKYRINKIKHYIFSAIIGFSAFMPWLLFILMNSGRASGLTAWAWKPQSIPWQSLVDDWLINLSRIFLDLNLDYGQSNYAQSKFESPLIYFIIIIIGYSFYFLCRYFPRRIWLFILTFSGIPTLILVMSDLLLGGRISSVPRYFMPAFLGIPLAVSSLLSTKLVFAASSNFWRQRFWQTVTIFLILSEIFSCAAISQENVWWNKGNFSRLTGMAELINKSPKPLLISDKLDSLLPLSYLLDSKTKFELALSPKESNLENKNLCFHSINNDISDVYFIEQNLHNETSSKLLSACVTSKLYKTRLLMQTELEPYYKLRALLWKIEKYKPS